MNRNNVATQITNKMKLLSFLSLSFMAFVPPAWAQQSPRETMDPKVTELWDPKPKKVMASPVTQPAPSDAIVLFDGKTLNEWTTLKGEPAAWDVKDGVMTVVKGKGDIKTKRAFGDVQLHLEWRSPAVIESEGQGRGNSGVFLQERYELQVLDSYESVTYANGQAGAIYKQSMPLVNATAKPGEWNSYDIVFTAPRFNEKGAVITPAYITVLHNGVIIQNHTQIWGPTEYKGLPLYVEHGKASIQLQDHSNPVSYRNIWVREL
jgi:Domain of Unknown Function (DUF1080)